MAVASSDHDRVAAEDEGIVISLDMDTSDGPCTDIDSSASHALGSEYDVAVCVQGLYVGFPIGVASFDILYDDTLNVAPEVADTGKGVDDNPDANAGTTKWGDGLGTNFDCSGGGLAYPKGDKDSGTGPARGDAFLSCKASLGPWTLGDDESSGVLGMVRFHALAAGTDTLTIYKGLLGYSDATEMGTCNPDVTYPVPCNDGEDIKLAPSPTPTSTHTPLPTNTPTPTITPTATNTPPATATPTITLTPSGIDYDGDGVPDAVDNCPTYYNPDQKNSDAIPLDNSAQIAGADKTIPNADRLGDACDLDDDNDLLLDIFELVGCGSGRTDPRGDVSYDDNQNGIAAPPMGTDTADDGPSWDTDGDGVLDGIECALGTDPKDPNSKPRGNPPNDVDRDGLAADVEETMGCSDLDRDTDHDGIPDAAEVKGWGTSCASKDTDNDQCEDWIEIVDINGDGQANALDLARISMATYGYVPPHPAFDMNKDGVLNTLDDMLATLNSVLIKPHGVCRSAI
jgi:hypothetical protein